MFKYNKNSWMIKRISCVCIMFKYNKNLSMVQYNKNLSIVKRISCMFNIKL